MVKKGDRFTNRFGKICVVKSVYKGLIKLQTIETPTFTETWTIKDFEKELFLKIPMPKIDRTNVSKYLLEYQLNLIGKTYYEAKHTPGWHDDWTIPEEQYKYLRGYAIPLLKKIFKFNKQKAEETFDWFYMHFGLKIER